MSLKVHVENEVSDQMFEAASFRFPINTPLTKEAYFYRAIFGAFPAGISRSLCALRQVSC